VRGESEYVIEYICSLENLQWKIEKTDG